MKVYGFQKTTLLDYPEHVAATIFTGGCNFRCPYCQNSGLVLNPGRYAEVPMEEIWRHLEKRKGILDGVCITGGEVTLWPDLEDFIRRVKVMGYAVKLDTNGYRPEVLRRLLEEKLLDYVAMDVKASKENYALAAGFALTDERDSSGNSPREMLCEGESAAEQDLPGNSPREMLCEGESTAEQDLPEKPRMETFRIDRIEESVKLLQNSGIPYEFRTTAVKGIHTVEEFERIGEWLAGSRAYFIQSYRPEGEIMKPEGLGSFSLEELEAMVGIAGKYIERVELRGVD